jgi:hypothetical protein
VRKTTSSIQGESKEAAERQKEAAERQKEAANWEARFDQIIQRQEAQVQQPKCILAAAYLICYLEDFFARNNIPLSTIGTDASEMRTLARFKLMRLFFAHPPCVHAIPARQDAAIAAAKSGASKTEGPEGTKGEEGVEGAKGEKVPWQMVRKSCSGTMQCCSTYAEFEAAFGWLEEPDRAHAMRLLELVYRVNCHKSGEALCEATKGLHVIKAQVPEEP